MTYQKLTVPSDLRPLVAPVWFTDDAREQLVLPAGATDPVLVPETREVRVAA